jgi:hypothetical protein
MKSPWGWAYQLERRLEREARLRFCNGCGGDFEPSELHEEWEEVFGGRKRARRLCKQCFSNLTGQVSTNDSRS